MSKTWNRSILRMAQIVEILLNGNKIKRKGQTKAIILTVPWAGTRFLHWPERVTNVP